MWLFNGLFILISVLLWYCYDGIKFSYYMYHYLIITITLKSKMQKCNDFKY